jgi:acyl-CoA-binding protein
LAVFSQGKNLQEKFTMAVAERFNRARAFIQDNFKSLSLSQPTQLRLYALFKYAQEGPLESEDGATLLPQPAFYQVRERAKWDAWMSLQKEGIASKDEAMLEYVDEVLRVVNQHIELLGQEQVDKWITSLTQTSADPAPKKVDKPTPLRELNERVSVLEQTMKVLVSRIDSVERRRTVLGTLLGMRKALIKGDLQAWMVLLLVLIFALLYLRK